MRISNLLHIWPIHKKVKSHIAMPRTILLFLAMPILINIACAQIQDPLNYPKRQEWIKAGFQDNEGRMWSRTGLSISEAKVWKAIGINYNQARDLKKNGINPKEAKLWLKAGYEIDQIIDNTRGDIRTDNAKVKDFKELQRWIKIGIKDPYELFISESFHKHPLTISQAEEWHKFGFSVLPRELGGSAWKHLDKGLPPKEARKQIGKMTKSRKGWKKDSDRKRFWEGLEIVVQSVLTLIVTVAGCIILIPITKKYVDNM
jgi:hypothetical protein